MEKDTDMKDEKTGPALIHEQIREFNVELETHRASHSRVMQALVDALDIAAELSLAWGITHPDPATGEVTDQQRQYMAQINAALSQASELGYKPTNTP